MTDDLRADVAELERRLDITAGFLAQVLPPEMARTMERNFADTPPKPRPEIEVVPIPGSTDGRYFVLCGAHQWTGRGWSSNGGGYLYYEHDANAIAAALKAAGKYPEEEKAR